MCLTKTVEHTHERSDKGPIELNQLITILEQYPDTTKIYIAVDDDTCHALTLVTGNDDHLVLKWKK